MLRKLPSCSLLLNTCEQPSLASLAAIQACFLLQLVISTPSQWVHAPSRYPTDPTRSTCTVAAVGRQDGRTAGRSRRHACLYRLAVVLLSPAEQVSSGHHHWMQSYKRCQIPPGQCCLSLACSALTSGHGECHREAERGHYSVSLSHGSDRVSVMSQQCRAVSRKLQRFLTMTTATDAVTPMVQ